MQVQKRAGGKGTAAPILRRKTVADMAAAGLFAVQKWRLGDMGLALYLRGFRGNERPDFAGRQAKRLLD
jgi:hypothetical protein